MTKRVTKAVMGQPVRTSTHTREKGLGELARDDIRYMHGRTHLGEGETVEDYARRLLDIQMEVYSAYAMRDLHMDFHYQPKDVQESWIRLAEDHISSQQYPADLGYTPE